MLESGSKKVRDGRTSGGDVGEACRGTRVAKMSRYGYERTRSMKAVQTEDVRDSGLPEEDGGSMLERRRERHNQSWVLLF